MVRLVTKASMRFFESEGQARWPRHWVGLLGFLVCACSGDISSNVDQTHEDMVLIDFNEGDTSIDEPLDDPAIDAMGDLTPDVADDLTDLLEDSEEDFGDVLEDPVSDVIDMAEDPVSDVTPDTVVEDLPEEEICVPTGVEICDGIDNDCNGFIDEGCDEDGDGYCTEDMIVVQDSFGNYPDVCPYGGGDCDDTDASVYPGAPNLCVPRDLNCDGSVGSLALSDMLTIRNPQSRGWHADMAYDGTRFGVVWVEAMAENDMVRYSALNPNTGVAAIPTVTLSPAEHQVVDVAITWDSISETYGVAWIAVDPERKQRSAFLVQINRIGEILEGPEYLGEARYTIRVYTVRTSSGSNGYFGVFTERPIGSSQDIYYQPNLISASGGFTVGTANRVAAERQLSNASIAWTEYPLTTDEESSFYLLWQHNNHPNNGIYVGRISGRIGNVLTTFGIVDYPAGNGTAYEPKMLAIEDSLVLIWSIWTGVETQMRASRAQDWNGAFQGEVYVWGTGWWDVRGMVAEPTSDDAILLARHDGYLNTVRIDMDEMRPTASNQTEDDRWWSYNKAPTTPVFMHQYFTTWQYCMLNQSATVGFFAAQCIPFQGSPLFSTEPISPTPFLYSISDEAYHTSFNQEADRIELIQSDPESPNTANRVFINRDGSVGTPITIGTFPSQCQYTWQRQYVNDALICRAVQYDYGECQILANTFRHNQADSNWRALQIEFPGDSSGSFCQLPSIEMEPTAYADDLVMALTSRQDAGFQRYRLLTWKFDGTPVQDVEILAFDNTGSTSHYVSDRRALVHEDNVFLLLTINGWDSDLGGDAEPELMVISIDSNTGIIGHSESMSASSGETGYLQGHALVPVGQQVAVITSLRSGDSTAAMVWFYDFEAQSLSSPITLAEYSTDYSIWLHTNYSTDNDLVTIWTVADFALSPAVYEYHMVSVRNDGTSVIPQTLLLSTTNYSSLRVTGVSDYYVVAIAGAYGLTFQVHDNDGLVIDEQTIEYGLQYPSGLALFYDETGIRYLFAPQGGYPRRLVYVDAECP